MANDYFYPITFGPMANCSLDRPQCLLENSVFRYLPNIPANATFLAAFGLMLIAHVAQGIRYKAWTYMACMVAGCSLELVGYIGRIMLHHNPFDFNAFLINLGKLSIEYDTFTVCKGLTSSSADHRCSRLLLRRDLRPTYQSVSIMLPSIFAQDLLTWLLSITHTDRSVSRFNPRFITFSFIPCDVISLVLQGVGGALSAGARTVDDTKVGVDVSKAGLIFQVITLVLFIGLSSDYLLAVRRVHRSNGSKIDKALKVMIIWLGTATFLILARCIFRIYELKDGYFGAAFRDEGTFIAFESV
jgi:hypothetical protein